MDLDPDTEKYMRESIESLLGLEISPKNMRMKLIASEEERLRLQEQVFFLEDRIHQATCEHEQYKAEAKMNAQQLKICIGSKAVIRSTSHQLSALCDMLETECFSFDRDLERYMDALEQNKIENDEFQAISQRDYPSEGAKVVAEIEALEKEKRCLLMNITQAEEEFEVLCRENKALQRKNNKLNASIRRFKKNPTGGPTKLKLEMDVDRLTAGTARDSSARTDQPKQPQWPPWTRLPENEFSG